MYNDVLYFVPADSIDVRVAMVQVQTFKRSERLRRSGPSERPCSAAERRSQIGRSRSRSRSATCGIKKRRSRSERSANPNGMSLYFPISEDIVRFGQ